MTENKATVSFWFDPICPWAWMTSRWILEVEKVRDIQIDWNIMSLQVLNEPKMHELPESYRDRVATGEWWQPVRLIAAAAAAHGSDAIGALYTAVGTRLHNRQETQSRALFESALEEVSLPSSLVNAIDSTEFDDDIRRSHDNGIKLVGQDVGTPVIATTGPDGEQVAFFGPVVTPAPKGEAAGKLWDGVQLVAATPGFYELKRTRTHGPIFE